jgi:uncharacterized peroxidase-related enzyme
MSFIGVVKEEEAGAELRTLYERIRAAYGFVPNFFTAQGRRPEFIRTQDALAGAVLGDGALPRHVKEQLAVVVSGLNTSSYCVALHMENLRTMGIDRPLGRKLATDYAAAPVEPNVLALFRFAEKLTRKPADIEAADYDALRQAGWSDEQVLEAVATIGVMNFFNRVSIGLGLMADF